MVTEASAAPVNLREEAPSSAIARGWLVAGIAAAAAVAVYRAWILARSGTPAGIDTGNWLAFGHGLFGDDVKPDGLAYPPLIPFLVAAAVKMFGAAPGVAIVGATSALMPAAAAFLALRWGGLGPWAAVAAVVLALPAVGEMTAWGGFPQLMAAPFVVAFLWLLDRSLRSPDTPTLLGAATAGALVLAASHFAAIGAAVAALTIVVNRFVIPPVGHPGEVFRRTVAVVGLTALFSLPLTIVYVRLVPAIVATRTNGLAAGMIGLDRLPSRFAEIHGAATPLLLLGLLAAVVAIVVPRGSRDALWSVNAALLTGMMAAFLLTREPRVLYEAPLVAAVGLGTCAREILRTTSDGRRRLIAAAMVIGVSVTVLVTAVIGLNEFPQQRRAYAIVNDDLLVALDWLRTETPEDSVIGVPSLDSAPLGWWVEGLAERRTLAVIASEWTVFPEERRISARAIQVFDALEEDIAAGLREARRRGVDYLLIPTRSPTYQLMKLHFATEDVRPSFANEGAVILQVPGAPS